MAQNPQKLKVGTCTSSPGKISNGELYVGKFEISDSEDKELNIPVFILQGSEIGPTCFMIAGISGTHVTGMMASYKLIGQIDPKDIKGTLVVFPIVNVSGYFSNSSPHPYDGKAIDTLFPGFLNGTISEQIAANIFKECSSKADFVVDLVEEVGNVTTRPYIKLFGLPSLIKENAILVERALSMGTDLVELEAPTEGTLPVELDQKNSIPTMTLCAGGKTNEAIQRGGEEIIKAVKNLLSFVGIMGGSPDLPPKQYIIRQKREFFAGSSGTLLLKNKIGDYVKRGDVVMTILNPESGEETEVKADSAGMLYQINEGIKVVEGDKLFVLANLKPDKKNKGSSIEKEALKVVKNSSKK